MERRVVLKLLAAGFLPAGVALDTPGLVSIAPAADSYEPEFFSREQLALLDDLTGIILPADDRSPGARAAKVSRYLDVIVSEEDPKVQQQWRQGVEAVEEEARSRFGKGFTGLEAAAQEKIVAAMAAAEENPQTPLERFFPPLKRQTVLGYYTSEAGIREDMRYQGNRAVEEFPGCTHPEHKAERA